MQCILMYLVDSARMWLKHLPQNTIKGWDDLESSNNS